MGKMTPTQFVRNLLQKDPKLTYTKARDAGLLKPMTTVTQSIFDSCKCGMKAKAKRRQKPAPLKVEEPTQSLAVLYEIERRRNRKLIDIVMRLLMEETA